MSVKQIKDIEVKCPNGHCVLIQKNDWEHEIVEVEDKSEHGMGNCVHHQFFVDGYCCPECNAEINAHLDVWEYPEGVIETTDRHATNVVGNVGDAFVAQMD